MNETYKVRLLGGTLVITLPQKAARALSIKAGDELKPHVGVSSITYERVKPTTKTKGKYK